MRRWEWDLYEPNNFAVWANLIPHYVEVYMWGSDETRITLLVNWSFGMGWYTRGLAYGDVFIWAYRELCGLGGREK